MDVGAAKQAAEDYVEATGVGCMVIGPDGCRLHAVFPDAAQRAVCDLATALFPLDTSREGLPEGGICAESHLYGACQSRRFGGEYIHFCPMGLACWTSPVMVDGVLAGALSGGPVHMLDPDEFLAEELVCGAQAGLRQREAVARR